MKPGGSCTVLILGEVYATGSGGRCGGGRVQREGDKCRVLHRLMVVCQGTIVPPFN
jgi:hypothetical protein